MIDDDRTKSNSPDQDQQWLEILAGREEQDVDEIVHKEAEALRTVILQCYQEELENSQTTPGELGQTKELSRLLERLDQEGLLEEFNPPSKTQWLQLSQYAVISVAAVLVMAVTLWMLMPPTEEDLLPYTSANFQEPPRLRSGMATQSIPVESSRHGREIARQLTQQLAELKIPYRLTVLSGDDKPDWQLEINIPFE
ncbi:MAG: hypothetical protein Q7T35_01870, partial [Nitrosomonas sp.]|nr:hypothetical protein [Nitrosomonas sp.]